MIELSRSLVDGMWRAWAEINRLDLGEITSQDIANGSPDLARWVCVAVAARRRTALREALQVMRSFTPKRPVTSLSQPTQRLAA